MGEQTQQVSLDFLNDISTEETSSSTLQKDCNLLWGRLVSLNLRYPNVDLIGENGIVLGRQSCCNIRLSDRMISGQHCKIYKKGGDSQSQEAAVRLSQGNVVFVQDLSSNGTFVNGILVGKGNAVLLPNGAELTLVKSRSNEEPVSYIYQDLTLKKLKDPEPGSPESKYDIRDVLGSGNFAIVKVAVQKVTGKKFALKIIDKKKYMKHAANRKTALMDEVNILQKVSHPNIIGIEEIFDTEKTLVTGGELFDAIVERNFFQEDYARELFVQLVDALHYLHSQGIVHRDLKPENILFANAKRQQVKISDFGLSRMVGDGSFMQTMCGTPQYLAPEIVTNSENKGYSKLVDMWSLGAILYIMLCGSPPFDDTKPMGIFEQVKSGVVEFKEPIWKTVSDAAKDLIRCLLTVDPSKRYDTEKTTKHPWITNGDLEELLKIRQKERELEEEERRRVQEAEERKMKEEEERKLKEEQLKIQAEAEKLALEKIKEAMLEKENIVNTKRKREEKSNKPMCKYGKNCYRRNPMHFEQFRHPTDSDSDNSD